MKFRIHTRHGVWNNEGTLFIQVVLDHDGGRTTVEKITIFVGVEKKCGGRRDHQTNKRFNANLNYNNSSLCDH